MQWKTQVRLSKSDKVKAAVILSVGGHKTSKV